jgi:hypothetical protein
MITVEQAESELSSAIAGTFPEGSVPEWRRDIAILVYTPLHIDPNRPNQYAREIFLMFGKYAIDQYRAAPSSSREKRCSRLRVSVMQRMADYDPATGAWKGQDLAPYMIDGGDAISD